MGVDKNYFMCICSMEGGWVVDKKCFRCICSMEGGWEWAGSIFFPLVILKPVL